MRIQNSGVKVLPDLIELPLVGTVAEAEIRAIRARQAATGAKGVFIHTLGCQMNEHDTEIMLGLLQKEGYVPVDHPAAADLILYNTCCVRENPERKIYGQIGMLLPLKELHPALVIGICGCMPQQRAELQRMSATLKHVDLIFGTHNLHRLPELLHQVETSGQQVIEVWDEAGEMIEGLPAQRASGLKAYVTIMYGCNEKCTYCVVPLVRGRERSRQPEAIVAEVAALAAGGAKEVMLLGQNVNAYGRDLADPVGFAELLRRVDAVPGIRRIRYTSPHPRYFTDDVIESMAACPAVCEHVHLPVQAGSDRVLRRMGRGYTRQHYLDLVRRLRQAVPDLAITTDLIVGFPGETEEDFQQTLSLIEAVGFDGAFMFIYSPRTGTAATRLPEQVPAEVKSERIHRLIARQNEISWRRNAELIGATLEVLADAPGKEEGILAGRTRGNKLVAFPAAGRQVGEFLPVRITAARTWSLVGEPAETAIGK